MPYCTVLVKKKSRPPSMNLNQHHNRIYLCVWYEKRKASISFFTFLWLLGAVAPLIPLVKCECIYFRAKVRIWVCLGEKYGTKFGLLFYYQKKKMLIFRLIITNFGTLRMHQIAPFLSFFSGGACSLVQVIINNHNRATCPHTCQCKRTGGCYSEQVVA